MVLMRVTECDASEAACEAGVSRGGFQGAWPCLACELLRHWI